MAKKAKSHGIGDIYKFLLVILVLLLSYYLVKSYMDYLKKKEGMYTPEQDFDLSINEKDLKEKINNRIDKGDFTGAWAGIQLSKILFPPTQELMGESPGKQTTGGMEVPPPS